MKNPNTQSCLSKINKQHFGQLNTDVKRRYQYHKFLREKLVDLKVKISSLMIKDSDVLTMQSVCTEAYLTMRDIPCPQGDIEKSKWLLYEGCYAVIAGFQTHCDNLLKKFCTETTSYLSNSDEALKYSWHVVAKIWLMVLSNSLKEPIFKRYKYYQDEYPLFFIKNSGEEGSEILLLPLLVRAAHERAFMIFRYEECINKALAKAREIKNPEIEFLVMLLDIAVKQ